MEKEEMTETGKKVRTILDEMRVLCEKLDVELSKPEHKELREGINKIINKNENR